MAGSDWAVIFVALISVFAAVLSGRAARAAAKYNSDASTMASKTTAETEAYIRARNMDLKTIELQDKEIAEIRQNNADLREKVRTLRAENDSLRRRVSALEQKQGESHGQ